MSFYSYMLVFFSCAHSLRIQTVLRLIDHGLGPVQAVTSVPSINYTFRLRSVQCARKMRHRLLANFRGPATETSSFTNDDDPDLGRWHKNGQFSTPTSVLCVTSVQLTFNCRGVLELDHRVNFCFSLHFMNGDLCIPKNSLGTKYIENSNMSQLATNLEQKVLSI